MKHPKIAIITAHLTHFSGTRNPQQKLGQQNQLRYPNFKAFYRPL
ncbi:hypothetical protein [Riemerella anatipestifer]|uniref:Uncharacterized protein n=1 Tax=Riemerella anatipestifer TaxID=34085 RepID=A0A1S7DS82_RIEAN|nr:hypothetical protein [Riemerella anatipestifer]AGC39794.1 hypothetical protein G148_0490 [Riemerella anatipestifer RA-CH-2]AKP69486.1 hypothetical protein CG08_1244 [Riemerella anatipestifer]AKP71390.1 hypothetical protein CG09_1191 [Riemerella anatipestifer]AQY21964.1 hypothetical protein AB406_1014 [Riemerella anatipestifer]MCQ4037916.1 hypothetical protein [Riemerella anatipestifer]